MIVINRNIEQSLKAIHRGRNMDPNFILKKAKDTDLQALYGLLAKLKYDKEQGYFERCLERQEAGDLDFLLGFIGDNLMAYGLHNFVPKYGLYKKLGISEIQDLNVHQDYRRRGIATRMIEACEAKSRALGHDMIGISVGLHSSYGPAQRLYFKLGYQPDGNGITYDRQILSYGEMRPNDDDLALMMIKELGNKV